METGEKMISNNKGVKFTNEMDKQFLKDYQSIDDIKALAIKYNESEDYVAKNLGVFKVKELSRKYNETEKYVTDRLDFLHHMGFKKQ